MTSNILKLKPKVILTFKKCVCIIKYFVFLKSEAYTTILKTISRVVLLTL